MKVEACYAAFKGDYKDVMSRLPKEAMVIKFLRKFVTMEDYNKMLSAVESKDYATVFSTSHNLKGMAANLSMTAFFNSISALCDCVRDGKAGDNFDSLLLQAKADYEMTVKAISELED